MLKKIYTFASFAISSIVLISSILLTVSPNANAINTLKSNVSFSSLSPADDAELDISIDPSDQESSLITQNNYNDESSYPDLGDDQVFPFVAGLDSYEGR